MRRLARHLFTLGSAASLLLCVAACVLWVRSYRVLEGLSVPLSSEPYPTEHYDKWVNTRGYAVSWKGRMTLHWQRFVAGPNRGASWHSREPVGFDPDEAERRAGGRWHFAGFAWSRGKGLRGYWRLSVPSWSAVLCTGVLPAVAVYRWRRTRSRRRLGFCPGCGYDLRATPGRRPECGTVAAVER